MCASGICVAVRGPGVGGGVPLACMAFFEVAVANIVLHLHLRIIGVRLDIPCIYRIYAARNFEEPDAFDAPEGAAVFDWCWGSPRGDRGCWW